MGHKDDPFRYYYPPNISSDTHRQKKPWRSLGVGKPDCYDLKELKELVIADAQNPDDWKE